MNREGFIPVLVIQIEKKKKKVMVYEITMNCSIRLNGHDVNDWLALDQENWVADGVFWKHWQSGKCFFEATDPLTDKKYQPTLVFFCNECFFFFSLPEECTCTVVNVLPELYKYSFLSEVHELFFTVCMWVLTMKKLNSFTNDNWICYDKGKRIKELRNEQGYL